MYIVAVISVIVLQLAAVTSDCPESSTSPRTLGSAEATPWHAVIYCEVEEDTWMPLCGGTLVSPTHVITAANCFESPGNRTLINTDLCIVVVGKQCQNYELYEQDSQESQFKTVGLHRWFGGSASNLQHDIAVLELKTAVTITSHVSPALIQWKLSAGDEQLPAGTLGIMAEWEGSESRSLSSVGLPYLDFRACADLVRTIDNRQVPSIDKFCGGSRNAPRTLCRQDIGAGYVYQDPTSNGSFLRGVLSTDFRPAQFTETCHEGDVAGFTNLADPLTLEWLSEIIPAPAVPCPAVHPSPAVISVYCHLGEAEVDCSLPMQMGTVSVSTCSQGYFAGKGRMKAATCSRNGTWTKASIFCQQGNYERLPCFDNLYKFHDNAETWPVAKTTCEAEGAHLAIPRSEDEFRALQNLFRVHRYKVVGATNKDFTWIGLKESDTQQGQFFSIFGEPIATTGFSRFQPGEPDHLSTLGDYMAIYIHHDGMHDYCADWNHTLAFACEVNPNQ